MPRWVDIRSTTYYKSPVDFGSVIAYNVYMMKEMNMTNFIKACLGVAIVINLYIFFYCFYSLFI